ncbi:MAG: NAD(P)/FAD-dependent oxidoreductase [Acidimicrobiales bacterium]
MRMGTVAVVGASLAGLEAARALRAQGHDGRIVIVGAEAHMPYDRPPLSKGLLTGKEEVGDITLSHPDDDALDLDWRLGTAATGLDPAGPTLTLSTGEQLRAGGVVIATGAVARQLPGLAAVSGEGDRGRPAGVHTLRTLEDALALRAEMERGPRLAVVGAGFIGSEVASAARARGLEVTVVEALPVPLAGPLGPEMGRVCAGLHADHGTRLVCGVGVTGLVGTDRVEGLALADGSVVPADVVVVGVGAAPALGWLAGSGLTLDGGVVCDQSGDTGVPGVVVAGDAARAWSPWAGDHARYEHWTNAMEQPARAVATLLGSPTTDPPRPPYFWSDQYGVRLQLAGHRLTGDAVRVVEGDVEERSFLAAYQRDGVTVAVLGCDRVRSFGRARRQLALPPGWDEGD